MPAAPPPPLQLLLLMLLLSLAVEAKKRGKPRRDEEGVLHDTTAYTHTELAGLCVIFIPLGLWLMLCMHGAPPLAPSPRPSRSSLSRPCSPPHIPPPEGVVDWVRNGRVKTNKSWLENRAR